MATRRNRIKPVINVVPRGRRPSVHSTDRPLTPIPSNLLHQCQETDSPLSPPTYQPPSSPLKVDRGGGVSPSPYVLPPSSSLLRSLSPAAKLLPPSSPLSPRSPRQPPQDRFSLVKSPGPPTQQPPFSPNRDRRPGSLHSPPYSSAGGGTSLELGLRSPPSSSSTYAYPFSPPGIGSLQRPSPAQSPSSSFARQYSTAPAFAGSPAGSGGLQRPSPVTSPGYETYRQQQQMSGAGGTSHTFLAPHAFNTNSNSADSHEVARFMTVGFGSPAHPPPSPADKEYLEGHRSITPSSGFGGAFSSVKDQGGNSNSNSSEPLLRQRLLKPSPGLTVSKYHTLRKEFMNKVNQGDPDLKKLSMLHFAFWNPPKKEGPGARSRASSVCSDQGPGKSSMSDQDPNSRHSLSEGMDASGGGVVPRRATIETLNISTPKSRKGEEDEVLSDTESTASSSQASIVPRVKVGPDGQLIIDEQSLVVETSECLRAKKQLSEMETVSGADFAVGSSGLFRNKKQIKRGTDWSIKETVKFYKGLSLCGTDFSMMSTIFPNRTRAELKSKFKREDRRNPSQISQALACQEFDPDEGFTSDEDDLPATFISGSTEQERLLQEEIEEERLSTLVISAPRVPLQRRSRKNKSHREPKLKSVKNENSKDSATKPGLPLPPWGSNNGNSLPPLIKIKKEKDGPVAKKAKNIKSAPEAVDDLTEPANPKNKKPRSPPKRRKSLRLTEKEASVPNIGDTTEPPNALDSLDILRFDASDPLGLKIVPIKVTNTAEKVGGGLEHSSSNESVSIAPVTLVNSKSTSLLVNSSGSSWEKTTRDGSISPCSFVKNFESDGDRTTVVASVVNKDERDSLVNKIKTPQKKVKVLPYRVPGPGGGGVRSPSLVDEIEIEISCQ